VTEVLHRTRGHAKTRPPRQKRSETKDLLELPEAQPVIARIAASVDPDYPNRMEHIEFVAAVVIAAKRNPSNAYARPTL
jgi:hypothetical protein